MIKLYGTLGPSCGRAQVLEEMIKNGMTGIRLNLSHGPFADFSQWLAELHIAEKSTGKRMEVLIDMEGPEIRIGDIGELELNEGDHVTLGKDIPLKNEVLSRILPGMICMIDDGKSELIVESGLKCRVIKGGRILSRKSFAVKDHDFSGALMTENDKLNIVEAAKCGVTSILQPFVKSGEDLKTLRGMLDSLGCGQVKIYAKIENQKGLDNAEEIIENADYAVFARGDLGNNISPWLLPGEQKRIAGVCVKVGKPLVIATQLLSSMENNPTPTRAELNDIYNSVLDGAEGLMLTGETAVGKYPAEAIKYLALTANEAFCRTKGV